MTHVEAQSEFRAKLRVTGAPKKHRRWNGPSQDPLWTRALDSLVKRIGTGFIVALIGDRGPGKTQLGVEMIKQAVKQDKSAQYVVALEWYMDLKSTYHRPDRDSQNERTVFDSLLKSDLLVLDEVHEGSDSEWERRMFTAAIDKRYREELDTIIIGNFGPKCKIETRLGDSVISRINETGGIQECHWPSFREGK